MYADLQPEKWKDPIEHPLVSSILHGVERVDSDDAIPGIPEDYEIDHPEFERIAPFLIHDADASQHSALVDIMQGKNVGLPDELTFDRAKSDTASGDLAIYTGAAVDFQINYGHHAKSPWSTIPFSNFPPYESSRFMDAVRTLREHARQTLDAIAGYSDIGVADVATLAHVANAASELPDLPNFDLQVLNGAELDDLLQSLDVRADLLKAEQELAALKDLRHEDPKRLAVSAAHMHTPASVGFLDQTPAHAYETADVEIAALEELASVIEGVLQPAAVLGLGQNLPAAHVPLAAWTAYALAISAENTRRWIVELPHTSMDAVVDAIARWNDLRAAETTWVQKASGYRPNARSKPSELAAAAQTLRCTGLGKLFAAVGGKAKAARALASYLGIEADPDSLEALAQHIDAVTEFERDQALSTLFGPAWNGLATPAEEVREGLRMRSLILNSVAQLPGASAVAARAMAMTPVAMAQLVPHREACKAALSLPAELKLRLNDAPADRFVASLRNKVEELKAFLAVDPGRWLAGVDAPFRRIAYAHSIHRRARRIAEELSARRTAALALHIGASHEAIDTAHAAIAWTKAVRTTQLKPDLKAQLLSPRAQAIVEQFQRAASDWNTIKTVGVTVYESLSEFGAQDLREIAPQDIVPLVNHLDDHEDELPDFATLRNLRQRLERQGLKALLDTCDTLEVDASRLPDIFQAVLDDRKAATARRSETLRPFTGVTLDGRRTTFRDRDKAKIAQDRNVIYSKLIQANPPNGSAYGPRKTWTEMQLLRNEFTKQKRFTPVRQLLGRNRSHPPRWFVGLGGVALAVAG
ncbi:MAG: hypothetical protein ACLPX8_08040 [Bryobacteraceae bacterium]